MTFQSICRALDEAGVENSEWDARLLLERFCNVTEENLISEPQKEYDSPDLAEAIKRRINREPLQYILGEWEFFRQTYEVSPDCLIPRSDTECLVERGIQTLPHGAYFADFCTGSGCIAVSLLAERRDTSALAADISDGALALANRNAFRNGVSDRLEIRKIDVLHLNAADMPDRKFDAILSNPPYILSSVIPDLSPEVQNEPKLALDGGEDGLIFYRKILESASDLLAPEGFFLFEIGYDQGADLQRLAEENGFSCKIWKDYHGCDRVVLLKRSRKSDTVR